MTQLFQGKSLVPLFRDKVAAQIEALMNEIEIFGRQHNSQGVPSNITNSLGAARDGLRDTARAMRKAKEGDPEVEVPQYLYNKASLMMAKGELKKDLKSLMHQLGIEEPVAEKLMTLMVAAGRIE